MQTRSSHSPDSSQPDLTTAPIQVNKAIWTIEDETALIDFLAERKAEAGDGANFKGAVWGAAAQEMAKHTTKGGVKTADACKTKWGRLKEGYNIVSNLRQLSGFTWSDDSGLDIGHDDSSWKAYCKAHPKATAYGTKGFKHYNAMAPLMSSATRNANAFRPTTQTRGTAIINTTPTASTSADEWLSGPPPPAPSKQYTPLTPIDSTPSALSMLARSQIPSASSKRRYSALEESMDNTQPSSSEKRQRGSGVIILNKLSDQLDKFAEVVKSGLERRVKRTDTTPERRTKALEELQHLNPPLQGDELIAMMDLFRTDVSYADTYIAIEADDTRRLWLRKRLTEAGFPHPGI